MKRLEIVKMRESKHDDQACLYQITDRGVVAHPDQSVLALLGGEEA